MTEENKKRIRLELVKAAKDIVTNTDLTPEDLDDLISLLYESTPQPITITHIPVDTVPLTQPYNSREWTSGTPAPQNPITVTCKTSMDNVTLTYDNSVSSKSDNSVSMAADNRV